MMSPEKRWWGLVFIILASCTPEQTNEEALFRLVSADESGITFHNHIQPDDTRNLLDFEYLYNGGGVGVGDLNNDGLPDLVFTGNMVPSRIYLNQGNLRFQDVTEGSGFDTEGKWCTGIAVVDINQDGWDDLYVCAGGPGKQSIYPNLLFVNQGDGSFVESAAEYGLNDPNESNQAVFFDYDKDGDLDMYLLNGGGFERSAITIKPILTNGSGRNTDKLYENLGNDSLGHPFFRDVSARAGITIEGFGLGVGIVDVNDDGWPDIYVSNDYLSRDLLYVNQQNGTFVEQVRDYLSHMSHFSMGNDIGDINNDGRFDIVTLDMLPEDHYRRKMMFGPNLEDRFYQAVDYGYGFQYMRNMLHLGSADNRFSEIGRLAGVDKTDWSWAPLIADLDNDGLQDLYITNGYGKDITDLDFVKFRQNAQSPFASQEEYRISMLESLEDRPSITLPNYVYRNAGDATFVDESDNWGITQPSISNGAVYVDLDLDGDLEIVTSNIDQPAFLYRNMRREQDSSASHFLNIRLLGPEGNRSGIGAEVRLFSEGMQQTRRMQPVRGFQSTVGSELHFGLGMQNVADSLIVIWPDSRKNVQRQIPGDKTLELAYADASDTVVMPGKVETMLQEVELFCFNNPEKVDINDFRTQPLLFHGFGNQGPGIAVGDINQDQLEDVIIGGFYGAEATIYLQQRDQSFVGQKLNTRDFEDLGMLLFDADQDQDLDLYITSGGSERFAGHPNYQDRLYLNNGAGNFTLAANALPDMLTSTASVVGADVDLDGDTDLFVGGRVIPGQFPRAPRSYLLINEGGIFTDQTEAICPELQNPGMVTSAIWTDVNNDFQPDLIVVGEWMGISIFLNENGQLQNISEKAGLANTSGMWNSILPADLDNDGDMDYVVGNIGLNTSFSSSAEHPLMLHYADFDQNGSVDPIYSVYEEGKYVPFASHDVLVKQLPGLRKKFLHYSEYASSTTADILSFLNATDAPVLTCNMQSSALLINEGGNRFAVNPLPLMAQTSPVKGMLAEDLNQDGLLDLVLIGNDYSTEVVSGIYSASVGQVLINEGDYRFSSVDSRQSGFQTSGDVRSMATILQGDNRVLLSTSNNSPLQAFRLRSGNSGIVVPRENEQSAIIEMQDGSRQKVEFPLGSGYISQSSRSLVLHSQVKAVRFFDQRGNETRHVNAAEAGTNAR